MKERNLFYFITALTVTILLILSLVIRTMPWFRNYGHYAMPAYFYFLIPTIILWLGWWFEHKGFLLASTLLIAVLFGMHLESAGILNNTIYVISSQAPIVRTVYVLSFMLILGATGLGFFTYYKLDCNVQPK